MEEESQLPTKQSTIEEEFYENMEAPKFVDLTLPDPYCPNDRYWFCLRVGCDQKHEEEMDPEAIYKDFVLRVMAARSPNIRLRKALNGKNLSTKLKCPLSAPAKSSKCHETISEKMADSKGKVNSHVKPNSTPVAKTRHLAAKYMTTPRNKMCPQKPNPFLSVQNPKPTKDSLPMNRVVAKALVFHSPEKTMTESRTPLRKICEGMTKVEMESQRKRILGYSSKSSKENSNSKKELPLDSSRKQLSTCKDKSIQCAKINNEAMDGDDKENALGCVEETRKNNQKALDKNLKDGGTTEVKYKKPKPTNPKPFRLRTHERGILKEAMERKSHFITPKEGTSNDSTKKVQNLDYQQSRAAGLKKTSRGQEGTEIGAITPKRTFKPLDEKAISLVDPSQKSENRFRQKESPSLRQQLVRPQGICRVASHLHHCQRLCAVKKTSSRVSKPLKPEMPKEKL